MTDGNGQYTFDNLPVLEEGESYTVSIDREASEAVWRRTTDQFRSETTGRRTLQWSPVQPQGLLTKDGERDPSLDFGFVLTPGKVSVGDYVWVDSNRDGIQYEGEKGIKGVVLTITGPDGKPVTDVFGKPVDIGNDG